jgi:hypothetical protein
MSSTNRTRREEVELLVRFGEPARYRSATGLLAESVPVKIEEGGTAAAGGFDDDGTCRTSV